MEPTLNPCPSRSSNTLFIKKLFPVLYLPATDINPNFLFGSKEERNFSASSVNVKPEEGEKVMKGRGAGESINSFEFLMIFEIGNLVVKFVFGLRMQSF